MYRHTIDEMTEALYQSGVDKGKARRVLSSYWADKIAIVWTHTDVLDECHGLTKEEAVEVLEIVLRSHNADRGVNWDVIRNEAHHRFGDRAFARCKECGDPFTESGPGRRSEEDSALCHYCANREWYESD